MLLAILKRFQEVLANSAPHVGKTDIYDTPQHRFIIIQLIGHYHVYSTHNALRARPDAVRSYDS